MLPLFIQNPAPSFQAYFSDAGAGVASLTAQGMGSTTATFTRASTAYTLLSNGLYGLVASNSPRSYYSPAGVYLGYLSEDARADVLGVTNAIRRTMTDVGWVATTMTVGAATGVDGVASSGASLTAGGANSTILFTTVLGAAVRTYSAWVRRKTGAGVINITGDNGVTWTAMTLTTTYTQFSFVTASAANPVVGFRIVTNTDAIEVDFNTLEQASFANPTPIPVNASKAADVLTYPGAGNMSMVLGTLYHEHYLAGDNAAYKVLVDVTASGALLNYISAQQTFRDGTNVIQSTIETINTLYNTGTSWSGSTIDQVMNSTLVSGSFDGNLGTGTTIYIGCDNAGTNQLFGTIRNVKIFSQALSASKLAAMTT